MLAMAKKPEKKAVGRPPGRKPTYLISVRIAPSIGEAFEQYVESVEPRTSQTACVELALKEFLITRGLLQSSGS